MSRREVTIGIDIGTTAVKAVAADADGRVVARTRIPHALRVPTPDRLEHNADEAWRQGPLRALKELARPDALAVAVSAMVPSVTAVDSGGRPIAPGLLYGDARGRVPGVSTDGPFPVGEAAELLRWTAAHAPEAAGYWPAPAVANYALAADAVVDAALTADGEGLARLLALEPGGDVLAWWATLVEPALSALSRRTVVDRPGASPATALSAAALTVLQAVVPDPSSGQPVIFVLAPGVRLGLVGIHVVATALAERGADARVVSGMLSGRHAVELVAMTRAAAVITVPDAQAPDLSLVERLADERPDVPQFVMVPDAAAELLPLGRSVHRARTVTGVVHEALAAAGLTGSGQARASVRATGPSHSG